MQEMQYKTAMTAAGQTAAWVSGKKTPGFQGHLCNYHDGKQQLCWFVPCNTWWLGRYIRMCQLQACVDVSTAAAPDAGAPHHPAT
jgi:hypothetical protein